RTNQGENSGIRNVEASAEPFCETSQDRSISYRLDKSVMLGLSHEYLKTRGASHSVTGGTCIKASPKALFSPVG
ncbi:hypothetical protein XELAEV_18032313mg, partial [Xenopus laevis]